MTVRNTPHGRRDHLHQRLLIDRRAVSLIEFALGLPLLIGFLLGGLEMANYILATNTSQRLASQVANLVAQTGSGNSGASEAQIYDIFDAIDVSAKPLDMRKNGRVIFTAIKGVKQSNGTVRNEFADAVYSQQFDGNLVSAAPVTGCHTSVALPTFSRSLAPGEILIHAQVTYRYRPLLAASVYSYFAVPTLITRTAVFRTRKSDFAIVGDAAHPVKDKCASATGL